MTGENLSGPLMSCEPMRLVLYPVSLIVHSVVCTRDQQTPKKIVLLWNTKQAGIFLVRWISMLVSGGTVAVVTGCRLGSSFTKT